MIALADSHIHLFRDGFAGRYGRSPVGFRPEVDVYETLRHTHHITRALVVGYEDDGIDPSNNEYLRELAESRPWMSTLAYLRAAEPQHASRIEQLLGAGHHGVALYLMGPAAADAVGSWAPSAWQVLAGGGVMVSVNVVAECLPALDPIARRHEGCTFLISHLGDPGSYADVPSRAEAAARLAPLLGLAELPNVHVKVSGLYAISDPPHQYPHPQATPFVDLVLETFGPGRCLWGSDFSPSLDFISFEQALEPVQLAGLSDADRRLVMGGNLLELLRVA